jgi:hypothetical protein
MSTALRGIPRSASRTRAILLENKHHGFVTRRYGIVGLRRAFHGLHDVFSPISAGQYIRQDPPNTFPSSCCRIVTREAVSFVVGTERQQGADIAWHAIRAYQIHKKDGEMVIIRRK